MKKLLFFTIILIILSSTFSCISTNSKETCNLFRIQEDGLYGFIDSLGNVKIRPQYRFCSSFSKDGYATIFTDIKFENNIFSLKYGYINKNNELVVDTTNFIEIDTNNKEPFWQFRHNFQDLANAYSQKRLDFTSRSITELELNDNRFLFQDSKSKLFGYKNKKNDIVIKPLYEYGMAFNPRKAVTFVAKLNIDPSELKNALNTFSLIDSTGNIIAKNRWNDISEFNSQGKTWGKTILYNKGELSIDWEYFDTKGNTLIGPIPSLSESDFIYNNYISDFTLYLYQCNLGFGTKYTYINKDGNFATDYNHDGELNFWSLYDDKQETFDDATPFSEGYAGVKVYSTDGEPAWMFMNKEFKQVSEAYDSVSIFSEGLAPVKELTPLGIGKWGYIDKTFNLAIPYRFSSISIFHNGLAYAVIKGNGYDREGYINHCGNFVWETRRKHP